LPFEILSLRNKLKEIEVWNKSHAFMVPGLGRINSAFSGTVYFQRLPSP
jgi:hypothetical protein